MDDEYANYDEFSMLKQYADHEGIAWHGQPTVARHSFDGGSAQQVSALVWGTGDPEVVLLHGGGQNAHTWDSVAMALDVPLVAIDLPGHGHSDWRDDHDYSPVNNAEAIAMVIEQAAPNADVVVGMSLGGLTNIRLAAKHPKLVRRAVIVDIAPPRAEPRPALTTEERGATALLSGPMVFDSFDAILQSVAAAVPGRPIESFRPGVLHNSRRLDDGRWAWRYDPQRGRQGGPPVDRTVLWEDFSSIEAPVMHVRGGKSAMVRDEDLDEIRRRQPTARIELVEGAGHSIQSDRPLVLAELITDFVSSTS